VVEVPFLKRSKEQSRKSHVTFQTKLQQAGKSTFARLERLETEEMEKTQMSSITIE